MLVEVLHLHSLIQKVSVVHMLSAVMTLFIDPTQSSVNDFIVRTVAACLHVYAVVECCSTVVIS